MDCGVDCMQPARFLCPWNSPGKNSGVESSSLLQGIFPTQNLCLLRLLHWQAGSLPPRHLGNPDSLWGPFKDPIPELTHRDSGLQRSVTGLFNHHPPFLAISTEEAISSGSFTYTFQHSTWNSFQGILDLSSITCKNKKAGSNGRKKATQTEVGVKTQPDVAGEMTTHYFCSAFSILYPHLAPTCLILATPQGRRWEERDPEGDGLGHEEDAELHGPSGVSLSHFIEINATAQVLFL